MSRVRVGFFSFTEVTDPAAHAAYNEWHMFDHMPEQFQIPGIAHGQRWVLTPDQAERATLNAPLDRIHYVTLYLMSEPVVETLDAFAELGAHLHSMPDRWFESRRSHVSGPWSLAEMAVSPTLKVSADALPVRPHRAIHVTVGGSCDLEPICNATGVAGAWKFEPDEHLRSRVRGNVVAPIRVVWLNDLDAEIRVEEDVFFAARLTPITPRQWDWFDISR